MFGSHFAAIGGAWLDIQEENQIVKVQTVNKVRSKQSLLNALGTLSGFHLGISSWGEAHGSRGCKATARGGR